jgi:hypothetical protein
MNDLFKKSRNMTSFNDPVQNMPNLRAESTKTKELDQIRNLFRGFATSAQARGWRAANRVTTSIGRVNSGQCKSHSSFTNLE